MPYQRALTIDAPVRAGARDELERLLATMGDGVANGSVLDFGTLSSVHFARLAVVEEDGDLPAHLILLTDFDVPVAEHLAELAERDGIDRLFGHCESYTPGDRLGYLRRHTVKESATYVNTRGRTAKQIEQEAKLRDEIQDFLDQGKWSARSPSEVRRAVRDLLERSPAFAWALHPAERPSRLARLREKVHMIGIPLLLLPLLPLALLALPLVALVLRLHERRDAAPHVKAPQERVLELAALEDHIVQNPFMAVGHVKPGLFRIALLRLILFGLDFGTRHLFNRGSLSGVKTIHFARWVFLDGRRRMFFASNYDGSMESYMDDFIDKVAWGLNLVFSNGVGYPKTRWLVLGGARDELAFKDYLRVHQVPTRVWYSAYGDLTALNIAQNERIRAGLRGGDERKWVQSL
ncbi:MAG TPA: hypothetical protein VFV62_04900 [Gaiellaceae bacterium]|nr:hypothetical protein [Gaiellaceae bacterium]